MILAGLYFLPAILVLIDVWPLKIAGTFLSFCFLPGLTLFVLTKKNSLNLEDLILVFPASIGISSLLTLGLLLIDVPVKFVTYIIYALTILMFLFSVIRDRKSLYLKIKLPRMELRFVAIAFSITLLFSIPVISERIAISVHGFHHLSLVTRVFYGFFPPENPGMGGTLINYQWGYHSLVAALSFPSNFHPLHIFSVLNIISLFFIFCIAYRSAKSFGFPDGYCYLVPLALIGLMRSDSAIFFFRNILSGDFSLLQYAASDPLSILTNWVTGISYVDRRLFFMNIFFNANNMPLGLCLIFAFFLNLLLLESSVEKADRKVYAILLSLILIALAINYAFFLIFILLFIPIWCGILISITHGTYKEKFVEILYVIIPCAIAGMIVMPYLFAVTGGKSAIITGDHLNELSFLYLDVQVIRNLIVFLLPSPFIIAGFWFAFKHLGMSRKFLFLLSGTLLCLLLSISLRLKWMNEAKFIAILSFFVSFPFIFSISYIMPLLSHKWLKTGIAACIVVFLLATPLITETAYLYSPWFSDKTYAFSGRHVVFDYDKSRNEGYKWIRDNTPSDALLMLPYFDTPYGLTIAGSVNYRPAALAERSLFVVKDIYAFLLAEYEKRVRIREQLFKNPKITEVQQYITSLHRPVYLLVEEGYEDPLLHEVEFDIPTAKLDDNFSLVFQNDRQRVYNLIITK